MLDLSDTLSDQSVIARTQGGSQLVLDGMPMLDEAQRRLLLLANGHTPLNTFMHLTGQGLDMMPTAQTLLLEGFVELVPAASHAPRLE